MDFTCIEIEGALYSPESVFSVGSFWIIPATSNAGALSLRDCKVFLVSQMSKEDLLQEVNRFIFCYQFLFLRSEVYFCCSLQQSFSTFIESGEDIHEIVDKIYKKYGTGGPLQLAFNEIGTFHTQLPDKINFVEFYSCFLKKYNEDDNFRNIIDLFLYTIGSKPKFYNNIYQKISQLQTILETIVGKPEEEKQACGKNHLKEEWKPFLTRKFGDRGFENNDIDLMVNFKTAVEKFNGKSSANGNFNPVILLNGSQKDVENTVFNCINVSNNKTFISAGCEVPKHTSHENMLTVAKTLRKY